VIEVQTGAVELIFQVDHITNMTWSPDGTKLALEVGPPNVAHQVFVIDARGGREISRFPGEQPAWSPDIDNQELIIKACKPECGLWRVGLDGVGGRLMTGDSTDSYPSWSPNGDYLVFASRAGTGDWEIYRLQLANGEAVPLTNRPGSDTTPVFSSDGLEVYFRTDAFGDWQIRAMAVDGSNERVVKDGVGSSDDWGLARPAVH
jgi:TolB protein